MRVLIFLLLATPSLASEALVVGRGGIPWTEAQDSARLVEVAPESLWTWEVQPGQNLSPVALARGGDIFAVVEVLENVPGGKAEVLKAKDVGDLPSLRYMIDGDEATAFDPDAEGMPREMEIYLDLGGAFRIDRTRLFPRLDSQRRQFFPQAFSLALEGGEDEIYSLLFAGAFTSPGAPFAGYLEILRNAGYASLLYFSTARPNNKTIVDWPGTLQVTGIRQAQYLRLQTLSELPWELAELELYSDGTAPQGEFTSRPLVAAGEPVWGRVRYEGGDPTALPIVLQTRTGPDPEPLLYFVLIGEREVQMNRASWEIIEQIEGAAVRGPVRPNPAWSAWQTVEEGIVRSPGPNRYLQFRLRVLQPGVKIEQLVFEYDTRPLAHALQAEISPAVVEAGAETAFTLSVSMGANPVDTGFRYLQILTPAEITAVDSLLVEGQQAVYTLSQQPGEGFILNLWERLLRDGSFAQLFFRGKVFADGTPFAVRGLDRRLTAEEADTAYQFAGEADVDPLSLGASLVVRLSTVENPVLAPLRPRAAFFTPNGDGRNEVFALGYDLLKLTRPAPVRFRVYDLAGRLLRQGQGQEQSGGFVRLWDGRDEYGELVSPGLYLYQVEVQADQHTERRQGVVGVGY